MEADVVEGCNKSVNKVGKKEQEQVEKVGTRGRNHLMILASNKFFLIYKMISKGIPFRERKEVHLQRVKPRYAFPGEGDDLRTPLFQSWRQSR